MMATEFFNLPLLNRPDLFSVMDLIIIFILSILSIFIITPATIKDGFKKKIFLLINFFGFFTLYFAFSLFLKYSEYYVGITLIIICETIFWCALSYTGKPITTNDGKKNIYYYDPYVSLINTSLIGVVYLLFIFLFSIQNNFSFDGINEQIFGTLLLISTFKTLSGKFFNISELLIDKTAFQFIQLHIYGYIFVAISIFLYAESFYESFIFKLTGSLLVIYSANEISLAHKNSKFSIATLAILLIIIFIISIISAFITATPAPLVPLFIFAPLMIGAIVIFNKNSYAEKMQMYIFTGVIICCFVLYYILTGEIFMVTEYINVVLASIFEMFESFLTFIFYGIISIIALIDLIVLIVVLLTHKT